MILNEDFIIEPFINKKETFLFSSFLSFDKYYWGRFFIRDTKIIKPINRINSYLPIDYNTMYINRPIAYVGSVFFFSLDYWQPHYSLMSPTSSVLRTYSSGFILKLYLILPKKFRRSSLYMTTYHFRFFKTFLPPKKKLEVRTAICKSYKRRYSFLINKGLIPFSKTHLTNILFALKTLMIPYTWRRVAPIKKRIRKRLSIRG